MLKKNNFFLRIVLHPMPLRIPLNPTKYPQEE